MDPRLPASDIPARLREAANAYEQHQPGARAMLLGLCRIVISSLETPAQAIQRMWWAEVSGILARPEVQAPPPPPPTTLPTTLLTSLEACQECCLPDRR